MDFKNDKAIYMQIADRLCDEVQSEKYREDERIPGVREYAVLLEVNVNTVVKSYELLAADGVIYNRRGLGYFVSPGAKQQIEKTRRQEFMKQTLPGIAQRMQSLGISLEKVISELKKMIDV